METVFRRFIILMIGLVFVNISLICREINTQSENRFNGFFNDLVIIFRQTNLLLTFFNVPRIVTLVFVKWYRIKAETYSSIEDGLLVFSLAMVYMYLEFCLSPKWTEKYRIEILCTELIVFQMMAVLHTILLIWKPKFFKVV